MSKNVTWKVLALLLVLAVLATACGATEEPAAPEPTQPGEATAAPEPTEEPAPSGEVQDFVTWYQFDQNNDDPANDEAVGNAYLRETIPQFNEAYADQWNWINVPKAWDKMEPELVAAVMAGGDVPDIFHGADNQLLNFVRNGAVQDLTDWAMAQDWYDDMDPNALNACTGQDGRLYCIPVAQVPFVTFVWADRFPDGFPTTPDAFMAAAERLDAEGLDVMTYFGSTDFDGDGAERAVWTIVSGFGGTYDDGQSNMLLNTPENVAAIDFLRTLAVEGYVPEVAFAGGFQEEEAFKDASAASIPTGLFGYRYIRPLTAPNGNTYTTETEQDMLDAIDGGDVIVRPFVAPEGNEPGCSLQVEGFYIPTGAQNVEAAYDYISWIMTDVEQNADWVSRAAAGIPALTTTFDHEYFQSEFYQQAFATAEASACRPPHGTLERWDEAKPMIMNAVYKLVKEDPTADIATELQAVQDEYNGGVQPAEPPEPTEEPAPSGEVMDFITWYQFDQDNEDPANDEAVGNAYLRDTIPQFNDAYAGKWNWINVPKAWDKMRPELVAAVQAGGDVPDLYHGGNADLRIFVRNGAVQDLTDWATAQDWYADMDPSALEACTGQDGQLYCIPVAEQPFVTFVWADLFPDGYPTTPEAFLAEAERLKAEGHYIMTYFGSTDFDGDGAERAVWTTISGFGGTYDDGEGNMLLNTPENISAIEFLRTLAVQEYVPEVVFAGGFQEEEAFKDASAASIPTGIFGYRYIRPLTAPDGTQYTTETEQDMLDAIEAGDVTLEPFVAPEGQKPGCGLQASVLFIPTGAENVEAAYDYINWLMTDIDQNVDWVTRAGSGIPSLTTAFEHPSFQSNFYQEARDVIAASACRPVFGSLDRWDEAKPMIMNAVYKLVKEDPTADIATELQEVQDEYNAMN